MKTLDRYLLSQLSITTAFGIGLFTILFISTSLIFQTLKLIVNYKVSVGLAMKFFWFSLPQVISYTIPMGTLLGVMNTFGQLSSNFEIIAFKTHGISFRRVVISALILATLLTILNLLFYNFIVPRSLREARDILLNAQRQLSGAMISGPNMTISLGKGVIRKIVASHWDPGSLTMYRLVISDWRDGIPLRIIFSDKAKYDPKEGKWILTNVKSFELKPNGETMDVKTKLNVRVMKIELINPQEIRRKPRLDEYTLEELMREIRFTKDMGGKPLELEAELHSRLAIPVAGLVFALLAAPLSNQPVRSSSLVGAGLSLLIILFYYIVFYLGKSLTLSGTLPPFIGMWLANILFGGLGLFMLFKES